MTDAPESGLPPLETVPWIVPGDGAIEKFKACDAESRAPDVTVYVRFVWLAAVAVAEYRVAAFVT